MSKNEYTEYTEDEEQFTQEHLVPPRRQRFCVSCVISQITDTKSVASAQSGDKVTETHLLHPDISHKVPGNNREAWLADSNHQQVSHEH